MTIYLSSKVTSELCVIEVLSHIFNMNENNVCTSCSKSCHYNGYKCGSVCNHHECCCEEFRLNSTTIN